MARRPWFPAACAACLLYLPAAVRGQTPPARAADRPYAPLAEAVAGRGTPAVPYSIVLRSRVGEAVPERNKDGVTGASHIDVDQVRPDTVTFWLRGAVAAASEQWKGGRAAIHFKLDQDFDVVPLRACPRPPRLLLEGMLIGTLQSVGKMGGSAAQGEACAAITCPDHPVLHFCCPAHGVNVEQKLFVNDRQGPFETVVAPGGFHLNATFDLSAMQPYSICHHVGAGAGAFFDPTPRLEPRWSFVQLPFRGVPSRNFGFAVIVRVVEDGPPPGAEGTESLPTPRPLNTTSPPPRPAGQP